MPRSFLAWFIALAASVGLAFALVGYHRRGIELLAMTQREAADAGRSEKVAHQLQTRLASLEKARAVAEKSARDAEDGEKKAAASTGNSYDDMRKDPAYAALWHKQQLRNVNRQYDDAIAALKLPPDQAAKLRDLLVARNDAVLDARDAAREQGLGDQDSQDAVRQARQSVTDDIKSLLGNDAYQQFNTQSQADGMKMYIQNSVAVDLTAAGAPLSGDQVSALASSYNEVAKASGFKGNIANQTPDPQTGLTPFLQAVLDHVSPQLSPAQVPVVRDYLIEQVQQNQYYSQHRNR